MTLDRPGSTAAGRTANLQWRAHPGGIWVAYHGNEFHGMVEEVWRSGFIATTRLGKHIGRFRTLDDAKRALHGTTEI
jgi:hypothetical protein